MNNETLNITDLEERAFQLPDQEIESIIKALHAQDSDTIYEHLRDLSIADTADLISKIHEDDRRELLSMYGETLDPHVFASLDDELCRITLSALPVDQLVRIISSLESDDALLLVSNLGEDLQQEIIKKLSSKIRTALKEGLKFPEDSAGRLMQREAVAVPQFWSVEKTLTYLREAATDLPEEFFDVFIINPTYHVTGQIPLNRLVRAQSDAKLESLTLEETYPIPADTDQEEAAHIFRRNDITSAPVIDKNGRLIGVITIDDIVDVIDEEAQEDLLKMAGLDQDDLYHAALSTTAVRFRWLFINLLTAILASIVISLFDTTIEEIIALAVLMPIVASMGGNAGTQALTVAVRALATRELSGTNTWRMIGKETFVGSINGIAFAAITSIITIIWFQDVALGAVIAMAMVINLFVAGLFGASIPIYLNHRGADPAVASTVLLTTITDIVGFFSFLGLAAIFLL